MFLTLRKNLDLTESLSDEEIWMALDKTGIKKKVSELPGGLDFIISEGNKNLHY